MAAQSSAALSPDHVRVADQKKTKSYLKDGLFVGGDQAVSDVVVRDIRRATNSGYERLVVDLEGNAAGAPVVLQRPPYYQVAVSPDERRLVFTVYGNAKLGFDPKKVLQGFAKSAVIQSVELLPRLEPDQWTFALNFKAGSPVEVFELTNPVRIIIDLQANVTAPSVASGALAKPLKLAAKKAVAKKAATPQPDVHSKPESVDPIPAESLDRAEGLLQKELEEKPLPRAGDVSEALDPVPGESTGH